MPFSETQIIVGLLALLVGSYGAFFTWLVTSIHRLDRKLDEKFDKVDQRLADLTVAVSRLEGAVYYGRLEPREKNLG